MSCVKLTSNVDRWTTRPEDGMSRWQCPWRHHGMSTVPWCKYSVVPYGDVWASELPDQRQKWFGAFVWLFRSLEKRNINTSLYGCPVCSCVAVIFTEASNIQVCIYQTYYVSCARGKSAIECTGTMQARGYSEERHAVNAPCPQCTVRTIKHSRIELHTKKERSWILWTAKWQCIATWSRLTSNDAVMLGCFGSLCTVHKHNCYISSYRR